MRYINPLPLPFFRSGAALAMRHRHRGLSTYGLNSQRQGDEHPRL